MKFVYQSLRLPFSHSHAHVFLSSKNFSKNFFPPLGLPLRNRISLDASQTPVLVKLSNVKLFVSRGRTARFVGRVLQSCVCFENINTILVLEFFSFSLSLAVELYILCKTLVLSRVGGIVFSCQQFRRIRRIREIYRCWITPLINVFTEKTSKNDSHVIKSSPENFLVFSSLDLSLIFCRNF